MVLNYAFEVLGCCLKLEVSSSQKMVLNLIYWSFVFYLKPLLHYVPVCVSIDSGGAFRRVPRSQHRLFRLHTDSSQNLIFYPPNRIWYQKEINYAYYEERLMCEENEDLVVDGFISYR